MDVVQLIAIAISWLDNPQEKDTHHDDGHFGPLSTGNLEWQKKLGQPVRIKTADTDRRIYDLFFH